MHSQQPVRFLQFLQGGEEPGGGLHRRLRPPAQRPGDGRGDRLRVPAPDRDQHEGRPDV